MPQPQKIKMYYDPRGQVVHKVNPDGTEQRVVFGVPNGAPTAQGKVSFTPTPWESYTYDANDLTSGNYAFDTPKSALVDALGRTIKTTEHRATALAEDVVMQYEYDIRGNLLKVTDALDRTAFEYTYDLKPKMGEEDSGANVLKTWHIDKGIQTTLYDASFKPIEGHDAKGSWVLNSYDKLQRPTQLWANSDGSSLKQSGFLKYGEGLGDAVDRNLRGKLFEQYDESGLQVFEQFDFKGNLLSKYKKVFKYDLLKSYLDSFDNFYIDWSNPEDVLEDFEFETTNQYDALNRITKIILPQDVESNRKEIVPSYNKAGALEKVSYDEKEYVKHIAYNAKGQRLLIAFGNELMTRYVYDSENFRLKRFKSEQFTLLSSSSTLTYQYESGTNKQDIAFDYDLVGNILTQLNRVSDCGINGSTLGSDALNRRFTYDPLYRLKSATGRESDTQYENDYIYSEAPIPGDPNANNVRAYTRNYIYDKMGNILQMRQNAFGNSFTRNYEYLNSNNTLTEVKTGSGDLIENFLYDANGNLLESGGTRFYKWTAADRLIGYYNSAGGDPTVFTQYDYDAGGNRVSKLVRTGTSESPIYQRTVYIDGLFEYCSLENSSFYVKNYVHVMDNQSRIAEIRVGSFPDDIDDEEIYILEDHLGSSTVRLNEDRRVIDREEYYPFGDSSLRTFSSKRYRYVGKEKDAESGLYYYGARYYLPWLCRFISVDPLAGKYAYYSPYQYAGNSPIVFIDLDGLEQAEAPTPAGEAGAVPKPPVNANSTAPQTTPKPKIDKKIIEQVKKAAHDAAKNGGSSSKVTNAGRSILKGNLGNFLKSGLLMIAAQLFTSTDDDYALTATYENAKSQDFADSDANDRLANELKRKGPDAIIGSDTNEKPDLVYRGGSSTPGNFTPAEKDADYSNVKWGWSTFRTPEEATRGSNDKKYQIIDLNKIRKLGFVVVEDKRDGHVSIRTPSKAEFTAWAATKEAAKKTKLPMHYRTVFLLAAKIGSDKLNR